MGTLREFEDELMGRKPATKLTQPTSPDHFMEGLATVVLAVITVGGVGYLALRMCGVI